MAEHAIQFTVNGQSHSGSSEARKTLADYLREDCGLTGTHLACEHGVCGACTVLLDGRPVRSCLLLAVSVDGAMRYNWPVSTGRSGYGTPSGVFQPQSMVRRWFSRKYYNSPMPHAIFFY